MKGSEKINKVLAEVGLNPSKFAKSIGLKTAQNVYDIQKDKVNISRDVALKIIKVYPRFDMLWLLTGEGPMLKDESPAAPEPAREGGVADVVIPADVWKMMQAKEEQMTDVIASLKARDRQVEELIKTRDRQIDDVIVLLREQIKKGESLAGDLGHAAQEEAALG